MTFKIGFISKSTLASNAFNTLTFSSGNYLSKTPGGSGSRRIFTLSFWVLRTSTQNALQYLYWSTTSGSGYMLYLMFNSSNNLQTYNHSDASGCVTTNTFTSTSAWYHIVCAVDTTQGNASNRLKLYVNGSQQSFSSATHFGQNADIMINTSSYTNVWPATSTVFPGQMAHLQFVNNAQLLPSDFSQAGDGGTVPKKYDGSFGTNGYCLDFANSGDKGNDVSGLDNDYTVTGSPPSSGHAVFY